MFLGNGKQPPRAPEDGEIVVRAMYENAQPGESVKLRVEVVTNGEREVVTMGQYNAWRVFGCLALMLGIKLPKSLGKSIKITDKEGSMKVTL